MFATALIFLSALIVFCTVGMTILLSTDRRARARRARIARYQSGTPEAERLRADQRVAIAVGSDRQDDSVQARLVNGLRRRMREAGLGLSLRAFVMLGAMIAVLVALPLVLLNVLAPILAVALGIGGAGGVLNLFLTFRRSARINAFNAALPAVLDILARSIRAGQPVTSAIGIVTQYTSGIAQEEFERATEQVRLGVALDDAIMRMADNVGTPEIRFIAAAIHLQTETGGNLVETLENMAGMLRERLKLKKKARALSAEAKVSAFILSALPFLVGISLMLMNPGYLTPLVEDPRGRIMLGGGLGLMLVGIYSMYKLAKIEA